MLKRVALLLTVVCLAGLLPGSLSCGESGDSDSGALVAAGEPPESSSTTMPSALRASYLAARQQEGGEAYHFAAASSGRAEAHNEASRLSVALEGGALRLAHEKAWELGLRWTGIGRGAGSARAPGPSGEVKVAENRASYLRADGSEEWYLNGPLGVEQGFVLEAPPEGARDQALVIEVSVEGGLTPALAQDGKEVAFRDARGATAAQYAHLMAFDAGGVELRSWIEVEGGVIRLRVDDAEANYPVQVDPTTWAQVQQLTALDGSSLGGSLAMSGDMAVVRGDNLPSGAGQVYVFQWKPANGQWQQDVKVTASDGSNGDAFGQAVSIWGSTLVVGAPNKNSATGKAYVFEKQFINNSFVWVEAATLTAPGGAPGDNFGAAVSMYGPSGAAIGAPGKNGKGAVYTFAYLGAPWVEVPGSPLVASDAQPGANFGKAVSFAANGNLLVGAPGQSVSGQQAAGQVYVFHAFAVIEYGKFTASDPSANAQFGASVAAWGGTAVIGAPYKNVGPYSAAGEAYIFKKNVGDNLWTQQQQLFASNIANTDNLGISVSISETENNAVVGAWGKNSYTGAVYVFRQNLATGVWSEQSILTDANGGPNHGFGMSVAISYGTIMACDGVKTLVFRGCTDADCSPNGWCAEATHTCTPKVANGVAIPNDPQHTNPPLDGTCTPAAATLVCQSGVCDADNKCGYANGAGPCTPANALTVCRSAICGANGSCGYENSEGPCTPANAGAVCQSGACSADANCMPAGGCNVDADCPGQWCAEATHQCAALIGNGLPLADDPPHVNPTLDGSCTLAAAMLVCQSGVCDADDKCGYINGTGSCSPANAGLVCRSAVCDAADSKCGYLNGDGSCTAANAGLVCRSYVCDAADSKCGYGLGHLCLTGPECRSGACSSNSKCMPLGGCNVELDCMATEYCDTGTHMCAAKLQNGDPMPQVTGHQPPLTGICEAPAPTIVCLSGVCDVTDNKCGYLTGQGPCDGTNANVVCREGACSTNAKCMPAGGCNIDDDCAATEWCHQAIHACAPKLANGVAIPSDPQRLGPKLSGECTLSAALLVCESGVCEKSDHQCGYANNSLSLCAADAQCRSGACSANAKCMPAGGCNIDADCAVGMWCAAATNTCMSKLANGDPIPNDPPYNAVCTLAAAQIVCESGVCDPDNKCGYGVDYGPCTAADAGVVCRSGACSSNAKCMPAGGCNVDADCDSGTQFCDTGAHLCAPKLLNDEPMFAVANHQPPLDGKCSVTAAQVVCKSGVCDESDDKCGYADGNGVCTEATKDRCRSGVCSADLRCMPATAGYCYVDADCAANEWCAQATNTCTPKLDNGASIPSDAPHTSPPLTGACTPDAADLVCASAVCDVTDDKCGYADDHGPCAAGDVKGVCRSGACSANHLCMPAGGCNIDADCAPGTWCNQSDRACKDALEDGQPLPADPAHTNPTLNGLCSPQAAVLVCKSLVCDPIKNLCGAQGLTQDKCTTDDDCKTVAGRGHCSREGVCCDQPCAGTCEQCLYPSVGTCSVQPGIDLHHECDKGAGGDADGGPEGEVNACGSSVCTPLEGAFGGECKPATSKTICSLGTCSQDGLHGTKPVYCSVEDGSSELTCLAAAAEVFECTTDYRCDVGRGQCKTGCSTVNDCVPGFVCNLSGRCVPQSVAFTPNASGGCSLSGAPLDDAPWGRLALFSALALSAARRRAVRRSSSHPGAAAGSSGARRAA